MELPQNRDQLRRRWESGERFEFFFFYGHKPPESGVNASCLSQWFQRSFEIDGIGYSTAEHWMMAEKARLFDDDSILAEILESESPRDAKVLGRKVRNFDQAVWTEHRFEIVKRGNLAKFNQNEDLKSYLLASATYDTGKAARETVHDEMPGTVKERMAAYDVSNRKVVSTEVIRDSNVILVEAAGRDTIWGIGLGMNNLKAQDPYCWRGLNLLGFVLTSVRSQLIVDP